jgi:hypothetical protein
MSANDDRMAGIKNNYLRGLALFLIGAFLFLPVAAGVFHAHDDCDHHDDCPICQWAINRVFVLSAVLLLFSCLLFLRKIIPRFSAFIVFLRETNIHIRSPPPVPAIPQAFLPI